MSCVTCDGPSILPATHSLSTGGGPFTPVRHDDRAHISTGLGHHIAPGGMCVLYRGQDITAQCIEAFAGPEGVGWAEMRLMPSAGSYVLHPAGYECVGVCTHLTHAPTWPTVTDGGIEQDPACPDCGCGLPPVQVYPAHTETVIRHGQVMIVDGVELITHPTRDPRREHGETGAAIFTGGETGDDHIREQIRAMDAAGLISLAKPNPVDVLAEPMHMGSPEPIAAIVAHVTTSTDPSGTAMVSARHMHPDDAAAVAEYAHQLAAKRAEADDGIEVT